jgi:hypothetical protein
VAHDHDSAAPADRPDDGVGVLLPAGRFVLAREVGRNRIVAEVAQCGDDQMPVPTAPPAAVDERERRHRSHASGGTSGDLGVDGHRHWKPAQQCAGIEPPRGLYDLRHTYATFALRAGVPVSRFRGSWARGSR